MLKTRKTKTPDERGGIPEAPCLPAFVLECELLKQGYRRIAGVDEVGRGALAGPLCLGMVVYSPDIILSPPGLLLSSVNDSKKLSLSARHEAFKHIRENALFQSTAMASHRFVDRLNINGATEFLLKKMIYELPEPPEVIIMDGNYAFSPGVRFISVKKGDSSSMSIASASVCAKIHRDEILEKLDSIYPGYGFRKNKGYGTLEHREAIGRMGPSTVHRRSFSPVRDMLSGGSLLTGHEGR